MLVITVSGCGVPRKPNRPSAQPESFGGGTMHLMDDSSRFRALTRDEQIAHATRVIAMARRGPSLVRCDGSRDDYIQYRGDGDVQGWQVCGSPVVGDLMLSVVRFRRVRLIVSVSHIDQITDEGVVLDGSSDVELRPGVEWAEVMRRAGVTHTWERLRGRERAAVLEALLETMSDEREVPEVEGREQRSVCRERSAKNRELMLDRADGRCAGCGINLRAKFGAMGDRGLEVHHKKLLSQRPGQVSTRLSDLVVLCATCHRLVHADADVSVPRLRDRWMNPAT